MAAELIVTFVDPQTTALAGELDTYTAQQLRNELSTIAAGTDLVMDLGELRFISSAGLSVILTTQRRLEESGGSLRLQATSPAIARMIQLSGVSESLGLT